MNKYNQTRCSTKIFTIPNVLSMIRIALIPIMVVLFFSERYFATAILLVVSAITDVVDGIIARRCNLVTELGKALDPIADKLTQIAVTFCLGIRIRRMFIPLVLLVIKEVFTGITQLIIIKKKKIVVGADWYGKVTTVFLYFMLFLHMVWLNIPNPVSYSLIGIGIALMVTSCVLYAVRNLKIISRETDVNEQN